MDSSSSSSSSSSSASEFELDSDSDWEPETEPEIRKKVREECTIGKTLPIELSFSSLVDSSSCNSSISSSASEFELDSDSDSDSDSNWELETEPEIREKVREQWTIGKTLPIELSFSSPGYLILFLFCIGHESMCMMVQIVVVEFIDIFKVDPDLAHLFIAITSLCMLRFSGGVWYWSTYEDKEYDSFKNIMKSRVRKSKANTMVGKLLQFDIKILKWFRRHQRFQGIWNILGFYLCEVAAIHLLDNYIATPLCSIPKSDLFDSMPSAQLQRNSFKVDFSPTPPIDKHLYRNNHPFYMHYDIILNGENLPNISPLLTNSSLNEGITSPKYQCIDNQYIYQGEDCMHAVKDPQVIMPNNKNYTDLENWFNDLYKEDRKYLDKLLTEESSDALFGDEEQAMFDVKSKFTFYFLSASFTFCVLNILHFDLFNHESF